MVIIYRYLKSYEILGDLRGQEQGDGKELQGFIYVK